MLDFNVGIFLVTAISSIGVLGIFIAGWASNNKYSVLSAMRAAVQMISYELSLGICLISAVVLTRTMQISGIVEAQTGPWQWLIFQGHIPALLGFIVFCIAGNAEANRGPFDLAEAESELTAGYHTEYSGMGFGFYYLAEYLNLFVISGLAATVFLGGWAPINIGIEGFDNLMNLIPGIVWFLGKSISSYVDTLDIPPFACRPDTEARVEIPYAAQFGYLGAHDSVRSIRLDIQNRITR